MSGKPLVGQFDIQSDAALRAESLGPAELLLVEAAMSAFAPEWLVELVTISPDETTLVLVPDDGDDATGPSFVVSRDLHGFRVDQVHWDTVTEVGGFPSLNDVLFALRLRLAFCTGVTFPSSMTMH